MISYHEAQALKYIDKQRGKATEKRIRDNVTDGDLILARMLEIGTVEVRGDFVQLTELGRAQISAG